MVENDRARTLPLLKAALVLLLSAAISINGESVFGAVIGRAATRLRSVQTLTGRLGGKLPDRRLVCLKIEKSKYTLTVLYRGRPLKSYPVVLGTDPIHNKLYEGDGCTPEGSFKIVQMRSLHKWSKFMLLDYPTAVSRRRFSAARKAGRVSAHATIGGAIGIHGVPNGYDSAIDEHQNWTAGCISLKTHDIDEIYSFCQRGTKVRIVH